MARRWVHVPALLGIVLLPASSCGPRPPSVQHTTGKEQSWFADFLAQHLVSVGREGDRVRFVSDGRVGVGSRGGPKDPWSTSFALPVSGEFARSPDHHAWASFKVTRIDPDAVIVEYTSGFDHRSFGKSLVTIDTGTVRLPYREARKGDE